MTDPTAPESPEPSMEEILASIRQIIADDLASVPVTAHDKDHGADEDVLILSERAPPEPSPFAPPQEDPSQPLAAEVAAREPGAPADPPTPADEVQRRSEVAEAPEAEIPGPEVVEPDVAETSADDAPSDTGRSLTVAPTHELALVKPETAAIVAASFERLSSVVQNPPPSPPPIAISAGGSTLEDITREILTPVINAWLDENLPAIVRARVDEEVERIARSRVR